MQIDDDGPHHPAILHFRGASLDNVAANLTATLPTIEATAGVVATPTEQ